MQCKGRQEEDLGVSEQVQELWYSVVAGQCSGVLWGQLEAVINAAGGGKRLIQAEKVTLVLAAAEGISRGWGWFQVDTQPCRRALQ